MSITIFISYKRGKENHLDSAAQNLRIRLESMGYTVWLDTEDIRGGDDWQKKIIEQIPVSDVVLLLLSQTAADAEWIRREIEIAKKLQIWIVPVLIEGGFDANIALARLNLRDYQYRVYTQSTQEQFNRLVEDIQMGQEHTLKSRKKLLISLALQDEAKPTVAKKFKENKAKYKAYQIADIDPKRCTIYLAAGDITDMVGIDVIVNSENTYMQMARVFETRSLSSNLRWHGSLIERGQLREDTVQQELYDQLTSNIYNIPVILGYVIPTHAGHKKSRLVTRSKARYIFHVATVSVDPSRAYRLEPASDEALAQGVKNCFEETIRVNTLKGVISPKSTSHYEEEMENEASYKPISSIIFPLFATGAGGRTTAIIDIAEIMINQFIECYRHHMNDENFTLQEIYLCAYTEENVQLIKDVMDRLLKEV